MKSHRKKGKERNGCIAWHQYSCLDSRPCGLKHCLYPASSAKLPAAINSSIPVGISARLSRGARTSPQDFILKTNKEESKKNPTNSKTNQNPQSAAVGRGSKARCGSFSGKILLSRAKSAGVGWECVPVGQFCASFVVVSQGQSALAHSSSKRELRQQVKK